MAMCPVPGASDPLGTVAQGPVRGMRGRNPSAPRRRRTRRSRPRASRAPTGSWPTAFSGAYAPQGATPILVSMTLVPMTLVSFCGVVLAPPGGVVSAPPGGVVSATSGGSSNATSGVTCGFSGRRAKTGPQNRGPGGAGFQAPDPLVPPGRSPAGGQAAAGQAVRPTHIHGHSGMCPSTFSVGTSMRSSSPACRAVPQASSSSRT